MGGESRYQIKIPSNQINIKNYYCSNSYSNSTLSITSLNPYFITGFSEAVRPSDRPSVRPSVRPSEGAGRGGAVRGGAVRCGAGRCGAHLSKF